MNTQFLKQHRAWLASAVLLTIVVGVFVARTAFARVIRNTIDPVALVSDKGRQLVLTGPIAITDGEKAVMRVTVTQRTTGAVAEGDLILYGNGSTNQWQVVARAQGRATFEPGPATAVGLAVSTVRGHTTDAHQWLVDVTLVGE